jgi:hypothetical protein
MKLLDRLRGAIRVRHMSARTEEAYAFAFHGMKHPEAMGEPEIGHF